MSQQLNQEREAPVAAEFSCSSPLSRNYFLRNRATNLSLFFPEYGPETANTYMDAMDIV
jgi:hypothetical protein